MLQNVCELHTERPQSRFFGYRASRWMCLTFLLPGVALPAHAHSKALTLPEIGARADIVFVGTAGSIVESTADGSDMPFTEVTFTDVSLLQVRERANLLNRTTIKLEFAGGEGTRVCCVPTYEIGVRYLVAAYHGEQRYFSAVVGRNQGTFRLITDAATGETHVLSHAGDAIVGVEQGVPVLAGRATQVRNGVGVYPEAPQTNRVRRMNAPRPTHAGPNGLLPRARSRGIPDFNRQPVLKLDEFANTLLIGR